MLGFAILLFFNLLGYLAQIGLHIPIPANVLGMIFLLLTLALKIVKLKWVEPAANFLLRHMLLFFVPFVVASLALWHLLSQNWFALIVGTIFSTLLTMASTGYLARWFLGPATNDPTPEDRP